MQRYRAFAARAVSEPHDKDELRNDDDKRKVSTHQLSRWFPGLHRKLFVRESVKDEMGVGSLDDGKTAVDTEEKRHTKVNNKKHHLIQ
jgi:hypothetical protein